MSLIKTGRIYKIIHNQSDIVYVGSTFQPLKYRFRDHKRLYKKGKRDISIYTYFEKYGVENFRMILINEYKVVDKKQLFVYETLWINKLKTINKNMPFSLIANIRHLKLQDKRNHYKSKSEHYKKKSKKYRDKNKEYYKNYNKEYNVNNKSGILKQKQEYYKLNNDKIKKYQKKYKEINRKKIICECGSNILKYKYNEHLKGFKHRSYILPLGL